MKKYEMCLFEINNKNGIQTSIKKFKFLGINWQQGPKSASYFLAKFRYILV